METAELRLLITGALDVELELSVEVVDAPSSLLLQE
jgi:hypothetical protein